MDLENFREYCLTKPNVTESTPFGKPVASVSAIEPVYVGEPGAICVTVMVSPAGSLGEASLTAAVGPTMFPSVTVTSIVPVQL